MVACLGALGAKAVQPVLDVPPGWYRVRLIRDDKEERKYEFLEAVADYPQDDGPDWRITLQRWPKPGSGI